MNTPPQNIVILHNFKDDPDGEQDIAFGPVANVDDAHVLGMAATERYADFLAYRVVELRNPDVDLIGPDPLGLYG